MTEERCVRVVWWVNALVLAGRCAARLAATVASSRLRFPGVMMPSISTPTLTLQGNTSEVERPHGVLLGCAFFGLGDCRTGREGTSPGGAAFDI